MRDVCDICRGRKIIRLPIYRRTVASFDPDKMQGTIEDSSREFPCPQCCKSVNLGESHEQ